MTQLTTPPNETYAVIVPKDSYAHDSWKEGLSWYLDYFKDRFGVEVEKRLIPFDFTILGTVTSESIDFDVSGIVKSKKVGWKTRFKNYTSTSRKTYLCLFKETSFRSLLKSKKVEIGENEKVVIIQKR